MEEESQLLIHHKEINRNYVIGILSVSNICQCLVIILLILLMIAAYFLYPRIPNSSVENAKASDYSLVPFPPSIILNFTFDVVLNNDNYYDIKIKDVSLDLLYEGARIGNFSLQYGNVTVLDARTANQSIPMGGSVNSATPEMIADMIDQATLSGYNSFLLQGNITMGTSLFPSIVKVPIQSEIYFFPEILPLRRNSFQKLFIKQDLFL